MTKNLSLRNFYHYEMSTHTIIISFVSGSGSRLSTPPSTVGRGGDNGGGARTPSPTRHSIEPPHYGVPKNIPVTSSQGNFAFFHFVFETDLYPLV